MTDVHKAVFVNKEEFEELLTSEPIVVADYTATWCGPCRLVAPLIEQLAQEYQDRVKVVKIDVDGNKDSAKKYEVKSIPAVLFFQQGQLVEKIVGKTGYENYKETLEKYIGQS
jgi:thioredoxin 1